MQAGPISRSSHGGHLVDLSLPHVRRFDDKRRKRHVYVEIHTWRGLSLGAKHWYVSVREEDNPIWDEAEQTWRVCWDDKEACGRTIRIEVLKQDSAWRAIRRLQRWVFLDHVFVHQSTQKKVKPSNLWSGG